MSRLTDLIAQAKARDPQLGADLEREFKALSSRKRCDTINPDRSLRQDAMIDRFSAVAVAYIGNIKRPASRFFPTLVEHSMRTTALYDTEGHHPTLCGL